MPSTPALDLVLTPNPPMGRHGMAWVMGGAILIGGGAGLAFLSLGAWPVTGFLGLDLIALWLALRIAARRARRAEVVRLDENALTVRRVAPDGQVTAEIVFDPYWARVALDERRRHDPKLSLCSHGRCVAIADFLPPAERRELARTLEAALAEHRKPAGY